MSDRMLAKATIAAALIQGGEVRLAEIIGGAIEDAKRSGRIPMEEVTRGQQGRG